ncbi:MAG: calcium/sodium antiporter [Candidatus Pacebacteria bacterium]|nr:calcium/sodium antiporter [Candidatus Paceibacterota bacterium]MCD8508430.1 calcium/sodium antiporter [Candidatus Paceibacterota bacterium]MCD8527987.1 calcium/sodium antiporter [Candidatus Paceibacterota bacterium]MCD8563928.1 calcium/sodium antiporter [Candidatus Paceibacterota bacterium]
MTLFWIAIFIISLLVMLRGGEWFLDGAEKIGRFIGLSSFIIGATIVAIGTSLPELISGIFATLQGATDIVTGNVIGSNIANILLVMGVSAVIGRRLSIQKDLADLDLPLLAITTGLFVLIVWDRIITSPEALILLVGQIVYIAYTLMHKDELAVTEEDVLLPSENREKVSALEILLFVVGGVGLILGSRYLVESVIQLSAIWGIAPGVIAISAVALGTSLPELFVSVRAALKGKAEVAFGNIFGSNVFNMLAVAGIPALIRPLALDDKTFAIGLPFLIVSTLLFIFSGLSRKMHIWEGLFFVLIYIFFTGKLFGFL